MASPGERAPTARGRRPFERHDAASGDRHARVEPSFQLLTSHRFINGLRFLGGRGYFLMPSEQKRTRAKTIGVQAWVNSEEYRQFVAKQKRAFEDEVDLEMSPGRNALRMRSSFLYGYPPRLGGGVRPTTRSAGRPISEAAIPRVATMFRPSSPRPSAPAHVRTPWCCA